MSLRQRRFQTRLHEAALGAVHRGFANRHGGGNARVILTSVRCKQDLRSLELACRMLAAA